MWLCSLLFGLLRGKFNNSLEYKCAWFYLILTLRMLTIRPMYKPKSGQLQHMIIASEIMVRSIYDTLHDLYACNPIL